MTNNRDPPTTRDNVRVAVHSTDDLREHCPEFDDLEPHEKRAVAHGVEPRQVVTDHNVTVRGYHETLAALVGGEATGDVVDAGHVAFGTDDTTEQIDDGALGQEVYRVGVSSRVVDGRDYIASTFLDDTEANGNDLAEVALVTDGTEGSGLLLNRATLEPAIQKTENNTATVDITLRFRDETEV